jgi:hypothetical protein
MVVAEECRRSDSNDGGFIRRRLPPICRHAEQLGSPFLPGNPSERIVVGNNTIEFQVKDDDSKASAEEIEDLTSGARPPPIEPSWRAAALRRRRCLDNTAKGIMGICSVKNGGPRFRICVEYVVNLQWHRNLQLTESDRNEAEQKAPYLLRFELAHFCEKKHL